MQNINRHEREIVNKECSVGLSVLSQRCSWPAEMTEVNGLDINQITIIKP